MLSMTRSMKLWVISTLCFLGSALVPVYGVEGKSSEKIPPPQEEGKIENSGDPKMDPKEGDPKWGPPASEEATLVEPLRARMNTLRDREERLWGAEQRIESLRRELEALAAQQAKAAAAAAIKRQVKEVVEEGQSTAVSPASSFSLQIWTNKPDGKFFEGETLVIFVKSERGGFLKLDYFQADGTVVHLVPNMFRGQARIQKGITYTFGGDKSPQRFAISGPFGHEMIKALISPHPIEEALKTSEMVSESQSYLDTLKSGLNHMPIQANASVTIVTVSKAVLDQ